MIWSRPPEIARADDSAEHGHSQEIERQGCGRGALFSPSCLEATLWREEGLANPFGERNCTAMSAAGTRNATEPGTHYDLLPAVA